MPMQVEAVYGKIALYRRMAAGLVTLAISDGVGPRQTVALPIEHARDEYLLREYVRSWKSILKAHAQ